MVHHQRFAYPRLTTVVLSYAAAALLIAFLGTDFFEKLILPFGFFAVLVGGALYTYSFTTSLGAIILLSIAGDYAPGVLAVIGGFGAVMSDLTILTFIKDGLGKEIRRLAKTEPINTLAHLSLFKPTWVRDSVGALIIASPLPDELGIAILASAKIREENFTLLAFIADMVGIYILVLAAQALGA